MTISRETQPPRPMVSPQNNPGLVYAKDIKVHSEYLNLVPNKNKFGGHISVPKSRPGTPVRSASPRTYDRGRVSPIRQSPRPSSQRGKIEKTPIFNVKTPDLTISYRSQPDSPLRSARSPSPSLMNSENRTGNIKVLVRVRPFVQREIDNGSINLISMNTETQTTTIKNIKSNSKNDTKEFRFDNSIWSFDPNDPKFIDQNVLYELVGTEYLDHLLMGYNTCIFAYGQTGSGKSFTMMGSPQNPGLIPRLCQDLFERANDFIEENISITVRMSYFEIYNEKVKDLLDNSSISNNNSTQKGSSSINSKKNINEKGKDNDLKLKVRESPTEGPYVENLSEFTVKSFKEVLHYINIGNKKRTTASTQMNDVSSRSHAVFTLTMKQKLFDDLTGITEEKLSHIRLVDLAGSERANSSGAVGMTLREGSNINKSLTVLGRVISALAGPQDNNNGSVSSRSPSPSRREQIPYRDSTLTWLLKESLGGNSKTAMIACISPGDYEEGMSTLRYADQAKRIRTSAVVNHGVVNSADSDKLVQEMQERINNLQIALSLGTDAMAQMDQFKAAIRFYEEKVIEEENKRKAILAEKALIQKKNDALTEQLKYFSLKISHGKVANSDKSNNDNFYGGSSGNFKNNNSNVGVTDYDNLEFELLALKSEITRSENKYKSDAEQFKLLLDIDNYEC